MEVYSERNISLPYSFVWSYLFFLFNYFPPFFVLNEVHLDPGNDVDKAFDNDLCSTHGVQGKLLIAATPIFDRSSSFHSLGKPEKLNFQKSSVVVVVVVCTQAR